MTELIVALDGDVAHAGCVFSRLHRELGHKWFKIGPQTLLQPLGMIFINNMMREDDVHLMLDIKLYDTRDTVKEAARRAFDLGARFLTVYADMSMVKAAVSVRPEESKVLAVPTLSDRSMVYETVISDRFYSTFEEVDGYVWPAAHIETVKRGKYRNKIWVCPGVRMVDNAKDNHASVFPPFEAKAAGADYIVVGRPILNAEDPVAATRAYLAELA